jgi:hypothetical protein
MAGYRYPGPKCQVRDWFVDDIEDGTSQRNATPAPGVFHLEMPQPRPMNAGFWLPPLKFAPVGSAQGDFAEFQRLVLNTQIMRAQHRLGNATAEIPESELKTVEGRFQLRIGPADKCIDLLRKARADLKDAKAAGSAAQDISVGLTSAYRGPAYDKGLWLSFFQTKYYELKSRKIKGQFYVGEKKRQALADALAEDLLRYLDGKKAAPGYSNHTRGIAVDFKTFENGVMHTAETGKGDAALAALNRAWEATWFYHWLQDHKQAYGMERIHKEAWHWEFK